MGRRHGYALLTLVFAACETSTGGTGGGGGGGGASHPDPYEIEVFDAVRINSHAEQPNFQRASATVDFGPSPFAKATLHVELESTCYPFSKWLENTPPAGHNWPADCDAFDRNFEFLLDPPAAEGGRPALELVRAITPFGGPMRFEVDLTDLANGLPGEHEIVTTIATWSDAAGIVSGANGGWNVSARLEMVPGEAPRRVIAVVPLANLNQTSAGGPGPIPFTVPEGTRSARLEYRVTGHGGGEGEFGICIGPADEFCKRTHTLLVDGEELDSFVPWRSDCGDNCTVTRNDVTGMADFEYCLENPCGDMRSVRASRANWCPGTVTPPFEWSDVDALLAPGSHTFSFDIGEVADGGSWRVSAVYYAFGE
ncbi:MAG TPA: peptide-N-glycosidase F-related protein [Vulgatibacter sp.]|nr:peptide-N-glycosidase F-related protein [Vulgatibacter sp.]